MAKESGLSWSVCTIDDAGESGRDIKNDVTGLSFSLVRGVQDTTGLDKAAHERGLLLGDFSITLNGVFNPASNLSHDVFKDVPFSAITRTVALTVSGQILNTECLIQVYDVTRAADGSLAWTVNGQLANGSVPTWTS